MHSTGISAKVITVIGEVGDAWAGMLEARQSLAGAAERLGR